MRLLPTRGGEGDPVWAKVEQQQQGTGQPSEMNATGERSRSRRSSSHAVK